MSFEHLNTLFKAAAEAKTVPAVAGIVMDRSGKVLYEGAFGVTNLDSDTAVPYTLSTMTPIFSCTKPITSVAALQLVERGLMGIDDPAEMYVPEIADIKLLDGFDDCGSPNLREPKNKITIRHLLSHSSGFTYDFLDENTYRWRITDGQAPAEYLAAESMKAMSTPLAFEPGTRCCYGASTDWLGFVIEGATGLGLHEVIERNILVPLGMNSTGREITPGAVGLAMHTLVDGVLAASPELVPSGIAEKDCGGQYLYSSPHDFATFLLTLLNEGTHPLSGVTILEKETVKNFVFTDLLSQECDSSLAGFLTTQMPELPGSAEFLPGITKGWSGTWMMNHEQSPRGRSAGSGGWLAIPNHYYWVDPTKGILGLVMSGILPLANRKVLGLFDNLERTAYGHAPATQFGEPGSNVTLDIKDDLTPTEGSR